jgi:hypothetical protein
MLERMACTTIGLVGLTVFGGPPHAAVPGTAFAKTATRWSLPAKGYPRTYQMDWVDSIDADWNTIDMNGDGKPDLASTSIAAKESYWNVYLNTGNGFAATPTHWAVPSKLYARTYQLAFVNSIDADWATIDMDGDGKPDLASTSSAAKESYWNVYLNTGSGFAATPTHWPVPSKLITRTYQMAWVNSVDADWNTIDMNGDGKPDLAFTSTKDAYWNVYLNTGRGFAASPTRWPVPSKEFQRTYQMAWVNSIDADWSTIDMDGDGKPDLASTSVAAKDSYWNVYLNTGGGFAATPARWPVPSKQFQRTYQMAWVNSIDADWNTIDINGDGKPDLASTSVAAKSSYWDIYLNTGSGFASTPTHWPVPGKLYQRTYQLAWVNSINADWTTLDLDGDGRLDFLSTSVGASSPYWEVYLNVP